MAIQTSAHIDGQGTNISSKTTRVWKDLDLNFLSHPVSGDINRLYDVTAIKRSVKNLIMTNHGERPFQPWLGSGIDALLFEQMSPLVLSALKGKIETLLNDFEPRVQLRELEVNGGDNNSIRLTLYFTISNHPSGEIYSLDTFLDRIK